jgi:hypothetical protein
MADSNESAEVGAVHDFPDSSNNIHASQEFLESSNVGNENQSQDELITRTDNDPSHRLEKIANKLLMRKRRSKSDSRLKDTVGDLFTSLSKTPEASLFPTDPDPEPYHFLAREAAWFLEQNTITAEKLANRSPIIQTYQPASVLIDAAVTSPSSAPYKIHIDLFRNLKYTIDACIRSHHKEETPIVIRCPVDFGHFFLDSVVELLAKDIGADVVHIDAQDFADLGEIIGNNSLKEALSRLPYLCDWGDVGNTEPDRYDDLSGRNKARCDASLHSLVESIVDCIPSQKTGKDEAGDQPGPPPTRRLLFLHIRDFKEMIASCFGRAVILALNKAIDERRDRGQATILIGSFCSADILGEFQLSKNFNGSRNRFTALGISGGLIVDVTPPGSSNQRAVLSDDRFRWIMASNIRRLKHALRARVENSGSDALSNYMRQWDISDEMESFRKSLEGSFWSRTRIEETVRTACGAAQQNTLKLEDMAAAVQVKDSSRGANAMFAESVQAPGIIIQAQQLSTDTTNSKIDEKIADLTENGTDVEKELSRGIVKRGDALVATYLC